MKSLNKNFLFNLLVLCLIIAFIGVGVKLLLKKDKWVAVQMWGAAGEWWWSTEAPPNWIANAINVGDVEYDIDGKKIGIITGIEKFPEYQKKEFLVKADLEISVNPKTGTLRYKDNDLAVGMPLTIKLQGSSFTGNIIWIEGAKDLREEKELEVVLKLYNRYPWEADAINVGDRSSDGSREIARILSKQIDLAEMTVVTDRGDVLARQDPLKRDITLKVKMKVVFVVDQYFFTATQEVKVGNAVRINMSNYNLHDALVVELKEL